MASMSDRRALSMLAANVSWRLGSEIAEWLCCYFWNFRLKMNMMSSLRENLWSIVYCDELWRLITNFTAMTNVPWSEPSVDMNPDPGTVVPTLPEMLVFRRWSMGMFGSEMIYMVMRSWAETCLDSGVTVGQWACWCGTCTTLHLYGESLRSNLFATVGAYLEYSGLMVRASFGSSKTESPHVDLCRYLCNAVRYA